MLTAMLFARDLDRMAAFYADGFGLTIDGNASGPGFTVLEGPARIALHAVPDHIADRYPLADPPEPRSDSAIKLLFAVADVAATSDRLTGLGATMFETPTDSLDGVDVEGNVFRIYAAASGPQTGSASAS